MAITVDGLKVAGYGGRRGPAGPQGEPGESAYQVAVDNGFVGTEAVWLASLKGPKGDQGEPGTDGVSPTVTVEETEDGAIVTTTDASGTHTAEILNGLNGTNGTNGTNGKDGENGVGVPVGGTKSQVLAKKSDTDYDTEWIDRWSNPNLLDNWYFVDPINQRGQTEYNAGNSAGFYSVDRWGIGYSILTVLDNGIRVTLNRDVFINCLYQKISMEELDLRGKTLTLSSFVGDCPDGVTMTLQAYRGSTFISEKSIKAPDGNQVLTATHTIPNDVDAVWAVFRVGQGTTMPKGSYITLTAAKLELGPQQTLAHQDADGNWVLNDLANYVEEYAKCAQYDPQTGKWVGYTEIVGPLTQAEYNAISDKKSSTLYCIKE